MFHSTLRTVIERVGGGHGAAVLSLDGLVVEAVDGGGQPCRAEDSTAEYARVCKQLLSVREAFELGEVEQLTVEGDDRLTVLRRIGSRFAVVLSVGPGVIPAKAHFALRVAKPELERLL